VLKPLLSDVILGDARVSFYVALTRIKQDWGILDDVAVGN
jgi:hypothetical protein